MSSQDSAGRIKSAASLLVKGGTLTSEACPKCGGVQVRFANNTTCINCGNETKASVAPTEQAEPEKAQSQTATALTSSVSSIMKEKIESLAVEIKTENDLAILKQKAELLESYLRILEKANNLMG